MNFTCTPKRNGHTEFGRGMLSAVGLYGSDGADARRQLTFDLYLTGFRNQGVYTANLDTFPKVPEVNFSISTDSPYSLIGRSVWEKWAGQIGKNPLGEPKGGLPSYEDVMNQRSGGELSPVVFKGCLLFWLRVAIASPHFNWGLTVPEFYFGLSLGLPPDTCCLGRNFLKHGLLCHSISEPSSQGIGITFFFPPNKDDEVWPITPNFGVTSP